jgi:hypothetical protein
MNNSQKNNPYKILKRIVDITFYLSILFFIIAFNFQDNPRGSWYKQLLPNLNGRNINDMTFIDSLNGFAVTNGNSGSMGYILKTTTGGNNWEIKDSLNVNFERVQFVNSNTGYVCAYVNQLFKTTNTGENWSLITLPSDLFPDDMWVLNKDTIWLAQSNSLVGGLFRSTNGGLNWITQYYGGAQNPDRIYMYDGKIGFLYTDMGRLKKTTDGGFNWILTDLVFSSGYAYTDLFLIDSLTGWLARGIVKKTTNGGLNWIPVNIVPVGGQISSSGILKFGLINRDTIWGFGQSQIQYPNNQKRGIIQKTTNSGLNWGYQIPDTSLNISYVTWGQFINKQTGWAYLYVWYGLHTTNGGLDTLIMVGINENISTTPIDFVLEQNYPNPFNQLTIINYQLLINCQLKLDIYDITGKLIKTLINQRKNTGNYNIKFDGSNLPSGIYFYRFEVTDDKGNTFSDVKKMLMIK